MEEEVGLVLDWIGKVLVLAGQHQSMLDAGYWEEEASLAWEQEEYRLVSVSEQG